MDHLFSTVNGRVRGRRTAPGVVAVLGIPYAAPPFGADRFKSPRPAPAWQGVRECVEFGPIAPQSAELPGMPSWSPGDEDVLNLNVWTGEGAGDDAGSDADGAHAQARPVFVWIHGGAYTFGASAQPDFDGTALVRAGLVVVTLNYRLGFEGFGHIPGSGAAGRTSPRTVVCSTRSPPWSGCATTSRPSAATRPTSPSPGSRRERRPSPV